MTTAYLGLGSNLGNRLAFLRGGRDTLITHSEIELVVASGVYETAALGGPPDSPPFLNAVLQINTTLDAYALLDVCHAAEADFGRSRLGRWAPRTLDVDLLFFADEVVAEERLTLPHPELQKRAFVLAPLAEIAPEFMHPVLQKSVAELAAANSDVVGLTPLRTTW